MPHDMPEMAALKSLNSAVHEWPAAKQLLPKSLIYISIAISVGNYRP
jgi:hypothetical protein